MYRDETKSFPLSSFDPGIRLIEKSDSVMLQFNLPTNGDALETQLVTTGLLGSSKVSGAPFMNWNSTKLKIERH